MNFSWSTAFKIAWREARSSSFKFLFVISAVAVGVGSLTGVRGFSRAFHEMLLSQARTLMAADLSLRVFELPNPEQTAVMDALSKEGVQRTWITETLTMASGNQASGGQASAPMLVSVKAVDPNVYPFYGEIRLNSPSRRLKSAATTEHSCRLRRCPAAPAFESRRNHPTRAVSRFAIIGQVTYEPDQHARQPQRWPPRDDDARAGLDRTGLGASRQPRRRTVPVSPRTPTSPSIASEFAIA